MACCCAGSSGDENYCKTKTTGPLSIDFCFTSLAKQLSNKESNDGMQIKMVVSSGHFLTAACCKLRHFNDCPQRSASRGTNYSTHSRPRLMFMYGFLHIDGVAPGWAETANFETIIYCCSSAVVIVAEAKKPLFVFNYWGLSYYTADSRFY